MRDLWKTGWHRFQIIAAVVSDGNARAISVLFYFTILVPFGLISRIFMDPMRQKHVRDAKGETQPVGQAWIEREPIPKDIEYAKEQG